MSDKSENKKGPAKAAKKPAKKEGKSEPDKAVKKDGEAEPDTATPQSGGGGMPRRTAYILLVLAVSFGILIWRQFLAPELSPVQISSVSTSGKARIGGDFSLVDHNGKTVTQADFKGRYMLIYFGYTFCPDVCPTSLSTVADALDLIGDKAEKVVPVFITVDPERDTPEQMKMYVGYFHPRLVGLSGSVEQVAAAADAFKAYFAKADEGDGEEYLMDHSSITYLMGPNGEFVSHFSHGVDSEEMAKRLQEIL